MDVVSVIRRKTNLMKNTTFRVVGKYILPPFYLSHYQKDRKICLFLQLMFYTSFSRLSEMCRLFKCSRNDLYETTWSFKTKLHMEHLERTQWRNVVLSKIRRSFFGVAITASVGPPFCTVSKRHSLYCGHTTAEKHVVRNG